MDVSEMGINNLSPKGLGGCLIFRHLNWYQWSPTFKAVMNWWVAFYKENTSYNPQVLRLRSINLWNSFGGKKCITSVYAL